MPYYYNIEIWPDNVIWHLIFSSSVAINWLLTKASDCSPHSLLLRHNNKNQVFLRQTQTMVECRRWISVHLLGAEYYEDVHDANTPQLGYMTVRQQRITLHITSYYVWL